MFESIQTFPLDKPALRALEIIPVQAEGRRLLMVRDPLGVIEGGALLVPDPLLLIFMQMADGNTTLDEMSTKIAEASGQILPSGLLDRMVEQLDEALLLQSDRFLEALKKRYEEYMNSPNRPYKTFAANGTDRLKMMKDLGDEFRRHQMSPHSPPKELDLPTSGVTAILSPHIDYQRGGESYAWAYKALREHGTGARTFIILGTSHRPASHRYIATRKNYNTPLGLLETDQELLSELEAEFGGELFRDEFLHADEHTVELQAVYLRKVFGDEPIRIVPILVDGFSDILMAQASPDDDPDIAKFCDALRTVLDRHGDSVALIGGVDFSHCGPEFGHEELNEPEREKEIESGDRAALEAVENLDPEAFFEHFRPDMNARNVCSIGAIYTVLRTLKGRAKANVLHYQQANSSDKACLVSFASVAFTKPNLEAEKKPKIILVSR